MPISPQELLAGRQMAVENDLVKVASACEGYGYELALLKIAEMEEKAKEEEEEEAKEERGESPKLSDEEKKEAAAMGLYTFEGFINKLAHAGEVMFGDPSMYIRQLAIDTGAYEKVAAAVKLPAHSKDWGNLAERYIARSTPGHAMGAGGAGGALIGGGLGALSGDEDSRLQNALVGAGLGGAAGAGLGYGARSVMTRARPIDARWGELIESSNKRLAPDKRISRYADVGSMPEKQRSRIGVYDAKKGKVYPGTNIGKYEATDEGFKFKANPHYGEKSVLTKARKKK